jgi:phosphate transport system substrate-binding protein
MKKLFLVLIVGLMALGFTNQETVITVKGSDTMVILTQRWAERYMSEHPGVIIQVTGGGSGIGIAALINGATDICNSSRPMKPSEREKLKARYNSLGVEIKSAKDALIIFVNESNSVKELSLEQLRGIYTGKIKNWKEVGGADAKIIIYGRENSSGTYVYFKDNVLMGDDYSSAMQSLPGTAAVVNAVVKDKNAIGYGGAAYAKGVKYAAVKQDSKSPAYLPTEQNIKTGLYPISRFLFMYTVSRPTGALKDYIDWILSPAGQGIVTKVGYFPAK